MSFIKKKNDKLYISHSFR